MSRHNNVNGTIRETNHLYENVNGTIREINVKYQNVNGTIRQTYGGRIDLIKNGVVVNTNYIKSITLFNGVINSFPTWESESEITSTFNYNSIKYIGVTDQYCTLSWHGSTSEADKGKMISIDLNKDIKRKYKIGIEIVLGKYGASGLQYYLLSKNSSGYDTSTNCLYFQTDSTEFYYRQWGYHTFNILLDNENVNVAGDVANIVFGVGSNVPPHAQTGAGNTTVDLGISNLWLE